MLGYGVFELFRGGEILKKSFGNGGRGAILIIGYDFSVLKEVCKKEVFEAQTHL